jgi:hypothetical protein
MKFLHTEQSQRFAKEFLPIAQSEQLHQSL